jgi:hypothetical protein
MMLMELEKGVREREGEELFYWLKNLVSGRMNKNEYLVLVFVVLSNEGVGPTFWEGRLWLAKRSEWNWRERKEGVFSYVTEKLRVI